MTDAPPWTLAPLSLSECTMDECAAVLAGPTPVAVLPVGSTEPHGPHLPLETDALLAHECGLRAARALRAQSYANSISWLKTLDCRPWP